MVKKMVRVNVLPSIVTCTVLLFFLGICSVRIVGADPLL